MVKTIKLIDGQNLILISWLQYNAHYRKLQPLFNPKSDIYHSIKRKIYNNKPQHLPVKLLFPIFKAYSHIFKCPCVET